MAVTAKNVSMAQNNSGGYSAKPMNKRPKPISLPPLGYDEFNPTQGHGFSSPHQRRMSLIKALQKPIPGKIEAVRLQKAHKRASLNAQRHPHDGPLILPELSLSPKTNKRRSPRSNSPGGRDRAESPDCTKGLHHHSKWLNSHSEERFAKLEELQLEQENADRAPTSASAAKKLKQAWMKMKVLNIGRRQSQQLPMSGSYSDLRRFSIKAEDFDPDVKLDRIADFNENVELIKSQSVTLLDRKTHFYKYGVPDSTGSGERSGQKKMEGRASKAFLDGDAIRDLSENHERRKRMAMYRYHRSIPRKVQPLKPFRARSDAKPVKKEYHIIERNASTKSLHEYRPDVKHQRCVEQNYLDAIKGEKYMSQWLANMDNHKARAMEQWGNWQQRVDNVKQSRKDWLKHDIKSKNSAHLKRQQLLGVKWITMIIAHQQMEAILRAEEVTQETHSTLESYDYEEVAGSDEVEKGGEPKSPKSMASPMAAQAEGGEAGSRPGTPDSQSASPKKQLTSQATNQTNLTVNRRKSAARKQDKKKNDLTRLVDSFKSDGNKMRRVLTIQFFLRAKMMVRQRREHALILFDALKSWQKTGPSKLMFQRYLYHVKRVQMWWRRYSNRMHNLRNAVSKQWKHMERHIVIEELKNVPKITVKVKRLPTPSRKSRDHHSGDKDVRVELSMNERIEANMLPDMCRTEYIIHEMRFQRHALLGSLAVWKQQMVQYYQDIQMWRMNRNARELMQDDCCSEDDGTMTPCPMMPGVPSHIPHDDDLAQWIKRARRNSMGWRKIEQTNSRLNRRTTADRFGALAGDDSDFQDGAAFVTQEDFFKDFK